MDNANIGVIVLSVTKQVFSCYLLWLWRAEFSTQYSRITERCRNDYIFDNSVDGRSNWDRF